MALYRKKSIVADHIHNFELLTIFLSFASFQADR